MNADDQLRRLLEDAVSDVEPRDRLDAIRARTAAPARPRRPWLWGVGGAMVATAATVAAVAALGRGPDLPAADPGFAGSTASGEPSDGAPVVPPTVATGSPEAAASSPAQQPSATGAPSATGSPSATARPGDAGGRVTVPVYYVGDSSRGPRLFREFHRAPSANGGLGGAVADAVSGAAADPDYRSDWPGGTRVRDARVADGVLTVDLSGPVVGRPQAMSQDAAELALQQLVYTAQGVAQQRLPVTFLVEGRPTPTLLGVPASSPVANAAAEEVLAQVWVTGPVDGSTVHSPFRVDGVAASFEANVQWELMQGTTVVRKGFTTAEECCTMAPYSFTVSAPPGSYTLVVHDEDASGEHPEGLWRDTKRVTVE